MKDESPKSVNLLLIFAIIIIIAVIAATLLFLMPFGNRSNDADDASATVTDAESQAADDKETGKSSPAELEKYADTLEKEGTVDGISGYEITDSTGTLAAAYLRNSTYSVTDFDTAKATANVHIEIPDLTGKILPLINEASGSTTAEDYASFKDEVFAEVEALLNSGDLPLLSHDIELSVKVIDQKCVLCANEELDSLITDSLVQASREIYQTV